jgi:HEAT repeat protein
MKPFMVALLLVGTSIAASTGPEAQSAISKLEAVRNGQVRFSFPTIDGLCGSGNYIGRTGQDIGMRWRDRSRDVEYDTSCESGPGRVVVERSGGLSTNLRTYIAGRWRPNPDVTDLGTLGTEQARVLLLAIINTDDGRAAREAILPLTLIDSVTTWTDLMRLARNDSRSRAVRDQAVFWLGQKAEGPATAGLTELVGDDALDIEVREQAVFALSQRPKDEGVPVLIKLVKTHRDPAIRRKALFWLGQSGDPRALDLIEELLAKR